MGTVWTEGKARAAFRSKVFRLDEYLSIRIACPSIFLSIHLWFRAWQYSLSTTNRFYGRDDQAGNDLALVIAGLEDVRLWGWTCLTAWILQRLREYTGSVLSTIHKSITRAYNVENDHQIFAIY